MILGLLVVLGALELAPMVRPDVLPQLLPSGIARPYPTDRVFRGFEYCRGRGRHHHEAIGLGGVGPDGGLGTAIRSMGDARITRIGRGALDPKDFGPPDLRPGRARRGRRTFPRKAEIAGYGEVSFFSLRAGKWRSGDLIELIGTGGPLKDHRVRYMHLAEIRPDLEVGDLVVAGEELGLLGGTGVMRSSPHVHIDIVDPEGRPVDVAPLLGLPPTARCGPVAEAAKALYKSIDPNAPFWHYAEWPRPVGNRTP